MKLRCKRDSFSQVFGLAAMVASSRREVKPILQNVKLVVEDDPARFLMLASDQDLSIRLERDDNIEIAEPGETILPTDIVKRILSACSESDIELETAGMETLITCGKSRYRFATQHALEFPDVPPFDAEAYHEVPAAVLHDLIKRTLFSADSQSSRYALNGVLLEFAKDRVVAVATDGKRLASQEGQAEVVGDHFSENTSIFSPQSLSLFDKALAGKNSVRISVNENTALFQAENTTIHCRLIDGRFPRWRNIIPSTEGKEKIDIIAGAFLSVFNQGQVAASRNDPGTQLTFTPGMLEISSVSLENGESKAEMPISYEGEPVCIKVVPRFVMEFLRELAADRSVTLYFAEGATLLFQTEDGYSYVVMPLA